jgi:hypothetical protein
VFLFLRKKLHCCGEDSNHGIKGKDTSTLGITVLPAETYIIAKKYHIITVNNPSPDTGGAFSTLRKK